MAITRVSGDAKGVVNVDSGKGPGVIVAPGIARAPLALKIVAATASAKDLRPETITNGAVERILGVIQANTSVIMYQVENDNGGQLSVLIENNNVNVTIIQTAIQALANIGTSTYPSNIGISSNIDALGITVTSTGGFKLA